MYMVMFNYGYALCADVYIEQSPNGRRRIVPRCNMCIHSTLIDMVNTLIVPH
jgi:hypothetical protein